MRRTLAALVPLAAVAVARPALADGKCPPGAWFCADVSVGPPAGEHAPAERKESIKPSEDDPPAPPPKKPRGRDVKKIDGSKSGVVEVPASSGGTTIIINTAPATPPAQPHRLPPPAPPVKRAPPAPIRVVPPPPPRRVDRSEWGFNLRLEGAMMGQKRGAMHGGRGADPDASMGGLGIGLRARPVRSFALQLDLDFIGGRDYNGYRRQEVPMSINAMVFVNPRSKVQVYFTGGLGWSTAEVETQPGGPAEKWTYFGLQGGMGLEWRVSRGLGLGFDVIGFIRGRTDEAARVRPEFVDPETGRATNTSGGGLARLGATFYWLRPRTAAIASFSELSTRRHG